MTKAAKKEPSNQWPADRVERRNVADLAPYARNARTHSASQIAQLAASIQEWGWTVPILVDPEGGIIAGHGRILAAQDLGIKEVPCMVAEGWTDAQKQAYVIADNRLAENAGWDEDLLKAELAELAGFDFDLNLIGFAEAELVGFLTMGDGKTEPDETPEPPETPTTVEGDVWVLGNHRIICGDSTDQEAVTKLLAGANPHLMVTDPPYGVEYDPNWRNERGTLNPDKGTRTVGAGGRALGKVSNDVQSDWSETWSLFPGEVAYVWCASLFSPIVATNLQSVGFDLRALIIWDKTRLVIGRSDYHWQHEPCWYAVKKGGKGHWTGDRKQTTVWAIPKPQKSETGHSTQKPVECMRRPIVNNSQPGDAIYEPFSGSGTTIIAAEMTGRACYAVELNPSYVDIAIQRWQNFTGQEAILESTEKRFSDVQRERMKG